jgi:O-antigen/teichoic acid export membrane protein
MIPVTIPLVESVGIAILDAKLKRVFRSVTLMIMAVINAGLTIVFVQFWGFWGALAGTVISLLVGHGLLMNIYYRKALKINVIRMFGGIFSRTLLAGLLSVAVCLPISLFINGTVLAFLVKGVCFVIVYAACLLLFALNKEEKQYFLHFFRK